MDREPVCTRLFFAICGSILANQAEIQGGVFLKTAHLALKPYRRV